jgi:hypothetical protein
MAGIAVPRGGANISIRKEGSTYYAIGRNGKILGSGDDFGVLLMAQAQYAAVINLEYGTYVIAPGSELFFTGGLYHYLTIEGDGIGRSVLSYAGDGTAVKINDDLITMRGLSIMKTGGTVDTGIAIDLNVCFNCVFEAIEIQKTGIYTWGTGIRFQQDGTGQSGDNRVRDAYIGGCLVGVYDNARTNHLTDCTITNCITGTHVHDGGNVYTGCTYSGDTTVKNVFLDGGSQRTAFEACWFENAIDYAIYAEAGSQIIISHCYIHTYSVAKSPVYIHSGVAGVDMVANNFAGAAPYDITIEAGTYAVHMENNTGARFSLKCAVEFLSLGGSHYYSNRLDDFILTQSKALAFLSDSTHTGVIRLYKSDALGHGLRIDAVKADLITFLVMLEMYAGLDSGLAYLHHRWVFGSTEMTDVLAIPWKTATGAPTDAWGGIKGGLLVGIADHKLWARDATTWFAINTVKAGTATILNGTSSIVVTHGMPVTPAKIVATGSSPESASLYVDTITATQFTIHAAGGRSDWTVTGNQLVYWLAE